MTDPTAIAAATAHLLAAILCAAAAVWTRVTGEAVWLTVLLVILGLGTPADAGTNYFGRGARGFSLWRWSETASLLERGGIR